MTRPITDPQAILAHLHLHSDHQLGPLPTPCYRWRRSTNLKGYGQLRYNHQSWLTHRLSWTLHHGPIPPHQFVLHKCDNPSCWNPSHLFLGSNQDNMADLKTKRRARPQFDLYDPTSPLPPLGSGSARPPGRPRGGGRSTTMS